jgi:hypothetical protein
MIQITLVHGSLALGAVALTATAGEFPQWWLVQSLPTS